MFGVAVSSASAAAPPVRVTVLAQPRFEELSHSRREDGSIEVHVRLIDDNGEPLSSERVRVAEAAPSGQLELSGCEGATSTARRALLTRRELTTDSAGGVCLRVAQPSAKGAIELTFGGGALHLPARAELPLRAAPAELQLAFSAPSLELDLQRPTQRIRLRLSGTKADEPLPRIELALQDGDRERALTATDWVRSGDTLELSLTSEQLGSPGPARLLARYAGSSRLAPAQAQAVALRVAPVQLEAELDPLDDGGAQLRVSATTPAGAPTSGWLEVSAAGESIATRPFVAGVAELWLPASAVPSGRIGLRYRADDPWWIAGAPLELSLLPAPSERPARWPWLVLLVPVGYVCLRSMQRPRLRKAEGRQPLARRAALRASPEPSASGWVGTISDAHEGGPIAGACVEALLPSLRSAPNRLAALTDANGWFCLPAHQEPLPEGARFRVSSLLHSDLERPLPPQGRVDVALVSRRRALLQRLVRWARSVGPPWVRSAEPTPAEIANVALRRGDIRTAQWAERVEAAAFGEAPVDQALEAALRAQEPPWRHPGQQTGERGDE